MPRPLPELLREAAEAIRDERHGIWDTSEVARVIGEPNAKALVEYFGARLFRAEDSAPAPYSAGSGGHTLNDLALELEDAAGRLERGHG